MKYITRDNLPEIPKEIATCPICKEKIIIEDIDEYELETGRVEDTGLHITCESQPDIDDPDFNDWFNGHFSMPYVDWLPVRQKVYAWFDQNYRLAKYDDENERLAKWNKAVEERFKK